MSSITSSRIARKPRAPVLRSMAFLATARMASSSNVSSTPSHLEQPLKLAGEGVFRLGQDGTARPRPVFERYD
jgi:hypothetical protein